MSQYLRAIIAQRLVPGSDGKRVAAVELMLNTPHISELVRKGDVSSIKEAIRNSGEKGIQSFDHSLVSLYKAGRVSMEDALANADSRTNLEARINFG
jgi:twitching motility protein PilU